MNKVSKLVGALIGSATPASIVGYLALFGIAVPENIASAILVLATAIGGALGVYVAPKNAGTDIVQTLPVYVQPEPQPATVTGSTEPGTLEPPYPSAPGPHNS